MLNFSYHTLHILLIYPVLCCAVICGCMYGNGRQINNPLKHCFGSGRTFDNCSETVAISGIRCTF